MKIQVGNKTITISKWKGKNKKEFIKEISKEEPDDIKIMDILVYSCIEEKNIVLTPEEFRYVLSRIRAYSLGEEITMELFCKKCGNFFERTFQIKDILKPEYKSLSEIKIGDIEIKLTEIKNKELFNKKMLENSDYELFFKVESFNDNNMFTFNELIELFDSLDVDILDKIIEIYEDHKFKVDDIHSVTCDCGYTSIFEFDELSGFFPDSWFKTNENTI